MTNDDPDRLPDLGIDLSQPIADWVDGQAVTYPWADLLDDAESTARDLLEYDQGRYGRMTGTGLTREDARWWACAMVRWCDFHRKPIPPAVHRLLFHCLDLTEGQRASDVDRMEGKPAKVAPESRSAFQKAVVAQAVDANASINSLAKAAEVERSTIKRWMKTPDWHWSVTWARLSGQAKKETDGQ